MGCVLVTERSTGEVMSVDDEIRELRDAIVQIQKLLRDVVKEMNTTTEVVTTMAEMLEKLKEEI